MCSKSKQGVYKMSSKNLPFGEFVKQRRESLGKTQKGFATEVEISPAYLSDIENGNRRAPDKYLARFASAPNITSQDDLNDFYDMAGISQKGQHSDINTYIDDKPKAKSSCLITENLILQSYRASIPAYDR